MTHFNKLVLSACTCLLLVSCGDEKKVPEQSLEQPKAKVTPAIPYKLVATHLHDTTAFTEGFLFYDNKLFESTGDVEYLPQTRSMFGIVDLEKGKIDMKAELDKSKYFGEGIVVLDGKIYQLTYQNQVGFIYDAKTFKQLGQFSFKNKEGWGMTTDGKSLIMSDGTFDLTYINPKDMSVEKVLSVTEAGFGLDHINELEYINGFIYANVWMTNHIVKIDPETGEVLGRIDLDELGVKAKAKYPRCLEMNGIAYNPVTDKILVTGKLWPEIYEISFPH